MIKPKLISFEIGKDKSTNSAAELKELANLHKSGQPVLIDEWLVKGLPVGKRLLEKRGLEECWPMMEETAKKGPSTEKETSLAEKIAKKLEQRTRETKPKRCSFMGSGTTTVEGFWAEEVEEQTTEWIRGVIDDQKLDAARKEWLKKNTWDFYSKEFDEEEIKDVIEIMNTVQEEKNASGGISKGAFPVEGIKITLKSSGRRIILKMPNPQEEIYYLDGKKPCELFHWKEEYAV